MAVQRARPYSQFNFMVLIGQDNGQGVNAGFQEVSGLGTEIHMPSIVPETGRIIRRSR